MTTKALISKLKKLNPKAKIAVYGDIYENGGGVILVDGKSLKIKE